MPLPGGTARRRPPAAPAITRVIWVLRETGLDRLDGLVAAVGPIRSSPRYGLRAAAGLPDPEQDLSGT
ncbi:hypothetical protein SCWH03_17270 [Streptomyces pacificus]|uniref:Uncharacterized protein n=1 Tax=Streptomyces pacificus TaxID=2705029 RepID=A0A6A0AT21_9ACTN|nr:hypothetical protein SCWH03_17270 [Streptomyces pacificus]